MNLIVLTALLAFIRLMLPGGAVPMLAYPGVPVGTSPMK